MSKKASDTEEWENLLYEYEESEGYSKTVSAEYLVDQSCRLLEELKEHTLEGRFFEAMTLFVEKDAPLPELYKEISLKTFLTKEIKTYKVMAIQSVKWGEKGLAVEFLGQKIRNHSGH